MTTLRTFPDSVTASIAQSVLRDHNIPCEMADIDSHLYSGAMFAIPVRLLVSEEYLDMAQRILNATDLSLPPGFDPTKLEE